MQKTAKEQDFHIYTPKLHAGQADVYKKRKRFNVLNCGRRWGKTAFFYFLVSILIQQITQFNLLHPTKAFKKVEIGYFAQSYKNLEAAWDDFIATFGELITQQDKTNRKIRLLNVFVIEFWSLDKAKTIRGRKYMLVFVDEAAYIENLRHKFNTVILPTCADYQAPVWFASSPQGFNDFEKLYQLGQSDLFPDWASWKRPSRENKKIVTAEELEVQKGVMTHKEYLQEYEAEFVTLDDNPFDLEDFSFVEQSDYNGLYESGMFNQRVRFWDLASSNDGDYTASVLFSYTSEPLFYLSDFFRRRGKWGVTYQFVKEVLLSEPDVMHVFETDGIGSLCYQTVVRDMDLIGIRRRPADRRFTMQSKTERASIWGLEAKNKKIVIVKSKGVKEFVDEVLQFPRGHDDQIDSVSGGFMSFRFFLGGKMKLARYKIDAIKESKPAFKSPRLSDEKRAFLLALQSGSI